MVLTFWLLSCRSILAEAVFKDILCTSPLQDFVHAESASIGPASASAVHDPRVMWAAQKAGVDLGVRNPRPFDETVDIVNYDLVLTMDHFDHEEVINSQMCHNASAPSLRDAALVMHCPATCTCRVAACMQAQQSLTKLFCTFQ